MTGRYLSAAVLADLNAQLTAHDEAVLKCVSDLRFVSGSQLTRLCFAQSRDPAANARAARRALVRLVRLDCLARLPRRVGGVRAGSAGFVYYLGLAGQHLAADRDWQPKRKGRRSLSPGTLFLAHTLQIAELHAQLVEADRAARLELLELAAEPACWRSYGQATLKPDSYLRLGNGAFEDSYFLEIDRGSEGSRTLERKLGEYRAYHLSGQEQTARSVFPKVLWLTNSVERVAVIEDCIERLPPAAQELFRVVRFPDAIDAVIAPERASEASRGLVSASTIEGIERRGNEGRSSY
jgi:hypothetical protein